MATSEATDGMAGPACGVEFAVSVTEQEPFSFMRRGAMRQYSVSSSTADAVSSVSRRRPWSWRAAKRIYNRIANK